MSFIQNLFTSRDNNTDLATYVGQLGRIWFDPVTNAFYVSDGITPGGILIGLSGAASVGGNTTEVQFNNAGTFAGNPNLRFDGSNLYIGANIIPVVNSIISLGSDTQRFKDIFLSNASIHIDSSTISANTDGVALRPPLGGTVFVPNLAVAGGNIVSSTNTIPPIVNSLILNSLVDYSSGQGDNLIPPIYGITQTVFAPWSVYQFTTNPVPILQVGDILSGVSIPDSPVVKIVAVGGAGYANIAITTATYTGSPLPLPGPGTEVFVTRPVTQAALTVSTPDNVDIKLVTGIGGSVIIDADVLPLEDNQYNLGSPARRFQSTFLGPGTLYLQDDVTFDDVALRAHSGNLAIQGAAGLTVGDFAVTGNAMTFANLTENVSIGTTGATGYIDFLRPTRVSGLTGQPILEVCANAAVHLHDGNLTFIGTDGNIVFTDGSHQNTAFIPTQQVSSVTAGIGLTGGGTGAIGLDATGVLAVAGTTNQILVNNIGQNITLSLPQSVNTTSSLTFANLSITGTLTVANLVTTGQSTVDAIVLNLGATTTSNSQINQGGIVLGNTAQAWKRSILYDLAEDRWNTGLAGLYSNNFTANNANTTTLFNTGHAHFGQAFAGVDFSNSAVQVDSNDNSFTQVVLKNHSSGTNASADFVAANDQGTDAAYYTDMGVNSSLYANTDYSITTANDGYLFNNGGNLVIGTQTAGKNLVFHTGGTTLGNMIGRTSAGRWIFGANTVADDGTSVVQIGGNLLSANANLGNVARANFFFGSGNNLSNIQGANITGTAANATYALSANTANTVLLGAQSNITSLGTLTSLTVSGLGQFGNINGGNITQANYFTGTLTTGAQPNITSVGTLTGLGVNGTVTSVNITANTGVFTGNGSSLTAIPGANVTGTVANATYAVSAGSTTTAGTVTTAAQPNITSVGTLSNLVVTGNISSGNANLGNLVNGNFFQGDGGLLSNVNIASSQIISTWTPTLLASGGGTITYASQLGNFIKSGRNVTGYFTIVITNAVGVSGTIRIGNLPYVSATLSDGTGGGALDNYSFAVLPIQVTGTIPSATSYVDLYWHDRTGSTNTIALMTAGQLGTVATLVGRINYISAA